jgi:flagellar basal-body rod protein FlgC
MYKSLDISASALVAQRQRLNTIAGNIANLNTTRDAKGEIRPFERRFVTFSANQQISDAEGGVGVSFQVEKDALAPVRRVYQPGHPDAGQDGFVDYPNIDLTQEFVNALEASRAYEANIAAMEMTKEMANSTLRIIA